MIALGRSAGLYDYLGKLSDRLRRVRVCCGDWTRVLTPSVTTYVGLTGVLLDPPYSHDLRERCYAEDHDISADVRAWAIEHLGEPLTVPMLARHANMSERTFARRFRAETGLAPRQWLTRQRLALARELLETTDIGIDAIAATVGYATATSLRNHLGAALGVSPLTYRQTFRATTPRMAAAA